MKTLFSLLLALVLSSASAEIINGYAAKIDASRKSLQDLKAMLQRDGLTLEQRARIKGMLRQVEEHVELYEITERLLERFREIAPRLYNEVDTITDASGKPVDVFVKFVSKSGIRDGYHGTTNLDQDSGDPSVYVSPYGKNTVSVTVELCNTPLLVLAHELGHVKYQVPNLADYCLQYGKLYRTFTFKKEASGHSSADPSGQVAHEFEERFRARLLAEKREAKKN